MAQCEAEGRKHPTMDLYVGIFNSKLYASRSSARVGAGDKWSRHGFNTPSANVENVCEDTAPLDRSSTKSRSFGNGNNKPPVFSDYTGSNRKLTSPRNVGSTKHEVRISSTDIVNEGYVKKIPASDLHAVNKTRSPQIDALCGMNNQQADVGYDAGHLSSEIKGMMSNVGHALSEKNVTKKNVGCLSIEKNSSSAEVGAGISDKTTTAYHLSSGINSSHAQIGNHSVVKESSKAAVILRNNNGTNLTRGQSNEENQTKTGNDSLLEAGYGIGGQLSDLMAEQEHYLGSKISHTLVSKHDATVSKFQTSMQGAPGMGGVSSNGNDQLDRGHLQVNGYARKSQELALPSGSSLIRGSGLTKADKALDILAARRSSSSSSECHGFESKSTSVALAVSSSDDESVQQSSFQCGDMTSGLKSEDLSANRFQNEVHNVGVLQARGRGSSGIPGEKALTRVASMNGCIKAVEAEGVTNELALKDSPNRAHIPVANFRVGGSASTDSSSSHGGSSHSGSPTAAEIMRESRVSSFGNILLSKGSPRSASSRSMGSASISGNGTLATSKSSFIDSPASQFRYSTSSGRKSAELVPNRRYSEIFPNRKSSEMMADGHDRGASMHGSEGNGTFGSGNSSRGSGSMMAGSNISLSNGNLLVGSTNGNVMSVGGVTKSIVKQGDVVNHASMVDRTLLKKAQASSDPEEIKNAGNAYYRRGHFSEALVLYTKAVNLWPNNAAYRSNRAAALSASGLLGEAVKECEDAIRLDSSYARAHQRVASLYLRLGLMERAKQHLNTAGLQADAIEGQRLRSIDEHMSRCMEARRRCEWQSVIRESDAAVVAGADSAPQIFGFKSEALLGLHRPDEADGVCTAAQRVESSLIKSGIILADPFLLIVRAQVDMALGRFEGALEAAKSAAKIDPYNENVSLLLRKAQAVCHTRTTGNELFKTGRFFEALAVYAEGLESDPMNAVLLCNRAACRSKLGQWEKSVEDCNAALRTQPNYTKALMRRANSWTKLERWEDALQDYELLRRKMPEDLEVARGLFDVQVAMKKLQGEDTHKMKFGGDVEDVRSDEQFQEAITSPGLSVVQFVTKWSERCRQLSPFIDDLCKRNPCVNFLRVDVEENPYLAKFECVSFIPTFKIYKCGQKVKEILGPTEQSLEYALKHYTL